MGSKFYLAQVEVSFLCRSVRKAAGTKHPLIPQGARFPGGRRLPGSRGAWSLPTSAAASRGASPFARYDVSPDRHEASPGQPRGSRRGWQRELATAKSRRKELDVSASAPGVAARVEEAEDAPALERAGLQRGSRGEAGALPAPHGSSGARGECDISGTGRLRLEEASRLVAAMHLAPGRLSRSRRPVGEGEAKGAK